MTGKRNTIKRKADRDGKYRFRWRTADGEQRERLFDTEAEARAYELEVRNELAGGGLADPVPGRIKFAEWAAVWQSRFRPGRPSSLKRDDDYLRSQVLPEFGHLQLGQIRKRQVQAWVDQLHTTGYQDRGRGRPMAVGSVHKCLAVLVKILDAAVEDERIPRNVACSVRRGAIDYQERRFLTPDEVDELAHAMVDPDPDKFDPVGPALVTFLATVGLRIGEACALRWRDVNVLAGTVDVRETLVEVSGVCHLNPPKTVAGRRTVPLLTGGAADALATLTGDRGPDSFVFGKGDVPLRPSNYRNRYWRPAIACAGLHDPQPTPHSLRHTAVSVWIAAGVEPLKVARWAGHRKLHTVYDLYGHLLPGDAVMEREAIGAILDAGRRRRPGEVIALNA